MATFFFFFFFFFFFPYFACNNRRWWQDKLDRFVIFPNNCENNHSSPSTLLLHRGLHTLRSLIDTTVSLLDHGAVRGNELIADGVLPAISHLLDEFLVLGRPDLAQDDVYREGHNEGETPSQITQVRRCGRYAGAQRTDESGEGKRDATNVCNVCLDIPPFVVIVVLVRARWFVQPGNKDITVGEDPIIGNHHGGNACHEQTVPGQEGLKDTSRCLDFPRADGEGEELDDELSARDRKIFREKER